MDVFVFQLKVDQPTWIGDGRGEEAVVLDSSIQARPLVVSVANGKINEEERSRSNVPRHNKSYQSILPCMRHPPGDEGVLLLVGGVALGLFALRAPAHAPAMV